MRYRQQRRRCAGDEYMVCLTPNLYSVVDNDGAVILDIAHNTLTTLDATGAYIWHRIEQGVRPEAIIASLAQDTGEDPEVIRNDLDEFLGSLRSSQLVRLSHDDAVVEGRQDGRSH
jgi:hypothetical protein